MGIVALLKRVVGLEASVSLAAPPDDIFRVVADVERWDQWLLGVRPTIKSGGPLVQATVVDVPLANFRSNPLGVATTFAALTRTGFGRAYGEMTVTQFEPDRKLAMKSQGAPIHYGLAMTVSPEGGGSRLTYRDELLEFGRLLGISGLVLLPISVAFLLLLIAFRPVFGWALRRRLRRVGEVLSQQR